MLTYSEYRLKLYEKVDSIKSKCKVMLDNSLLLHYNIDIDTSDFLNQTSGNDYELDEDEYFDSIKPKLSVFLNKNIKKAHVVKDLLFAAGPFIRQWDIYHFDIVILKKKVQMHGYELPNILKINDNLT